MAMHKEMHRPPKWFRPVCLVFRLLATLLAAMSATVMAASGECKPNSGADAFTYTSVHGFVLLFRCSITATILGAVALYLQQCLDLVHDITATASAVDDYKPVTDKEQGNVAAKILLVLLDVFVLSILVAGVTTAYLFAADHADQIGACPRFVRQVERAEIMSVAACFAAIIVSILHQLGQQHLV